MHVFRYVVVTLLLFTFLLAGCGGPPAVTASNKKATAVEIVRGNDGFRLTTESLFNRLLMTTLVPQGGQAPPADVRDYLDTLLLDTLTGLAAASVDLEDYYLDRWTYRLRYHDFLVQTFFDERARYRIEADSAEILAFYNEHLDLFSYPEQVQMSHILLTTKGLLASDDSSFFKELSPEDLEDTLRNLAFAIYDSAQAGADFGDLATRFSHDQISNVKYGYVGWTPRGRYLDPFDSVAFALEPPATSRPYQDKDGWHLLYVEDKLPEGPVSLERDGVWDGVKTTLVNIRVDSVSNEIIDSLRQVMTIEYNEELLDTNVFLVADSQWAGVANGRDTIDFRFLKNIEQDYRGRFKVASTPPDIRKLMIQEFGLRFTIVKAAEDLGFDTLGYVAQERASLLHNTRKSILERDRFDPSWKPDDSTVDAFYAAHLDRYQFDQPYRVTRIVVNDSVLAVYLRDLAESGYEFEELVNGYVPPGQGLTGRYEELGWVGPADLDSTLYAGVKRTPTGGVSRPVGFDGEWHLLKVIEARQEQSLIQARGNIVSELVWVYRRGAVRQVLDNLIARFGVATEKNLPAFYLPPVPERILE